MVRDSVRTGLSFGLTSGIITTLGLIVGLSSGTSSKPVVIGGILTIAIADSFSDALGIHISEESEAKHTPREIWESTITTFLAKFAFASAFIIPVLLLQLTAAIIVSVILGLLLLGIVSFIIARQEEARPLGVITEHLFVAVIVIAATYYAGIWIAAMFG
ncbi:MAG TPA: VIT1/CCC1 transporter family protein [Anaerolineae bacterium]|jgi:VIT1/CCC1 family predicted Fe2+/Mn2+ transporter|nr:VIT1/CCC1 transporter family protein [Anaerolineae bacterium]